jgi:type IV pilus assembly protein PilF
VKRITIICFWAFTIGLAGCTTSSTNSPPSDPQRASQINLDLAVDYLRKGNLAQAKEKLDRALEQNPRNAAAHSVAGMLYNRLGDTNKADSHYQRAVSLDPENSEYKNNYAVYLCQHNRFDRGEKLALQAAGDLLYKTREVGFLNAGTCARNGGNIKRAEEHLRAAVKLRPRFGEALYQLAELEYQQKNYMSARGFLERYMEVGRTTPASLWLGVRIERGLGNTAVAQHYANRLKTEYPHANQTKELVESERNPG